MDELIKLTANIVNLELASADKQTNLDARNGCTRIRIYHAGEKNTAMRGGKIRRADL